MAVVNSLAAWLASTRSPLGTSDTAQGVVRNFGTNCFVIEKKIKSQNLELNHKKLCV